MRIQFIIEVYVFMCGHFFMVRIDMDPCLWHCWAVYHFHGYLNQMPKALSQSFYISRIEKDWEFWFELFRWPVRNHWEIIELQAIC